MNFKKLPNFRVLNLIKFTCMAKVVQYYSLRQFYIGRKCPSQNS